jgi:phospholipase C
MRIPSPRISIHLSLTVIGLCAAAAVLLNLNGCTGTSSVLHSATPPQFQHVVIIFQENRSTDNLFQDPVLVSRGADIVSSGVNSQGQTITLAPIGLVTNFDLSHTHKAFETMYDGGKMDGADQNPVACDSGATNCPQPNVQFSYVNPSDIQPYFALAEQYTFGDRMFQTNQGPSFPAHQFILSGTSAPSVGSDLFAAENLNQPSQNAGCIAAPNITVALIDPSGNESQTSYPCYEHPTLTDLLNQKGISWKYYAPSPGSIWTAPNAIQHMCGPNNPPPNGTECTGSDWVNNVSLQSKSNPAPILTDISNNNLPAVSWIIPSAANSDHADLNDGGGPSWVASIVNAIGNSPYWGNTAIIISWDDWGGWYDHVAPRVINSYEYGFRVPLIVVSPYAKPQYISHVSHDFGSILKFIEEDFGLASLGYADAVADDLSDCFNLTQQPLTFQTIPAPVSADFFMHDQRPPEGPDND